MEAVQAVLPQLQHGHWPMRTAALEALQQIATSGDQQVLTAVVPLVHDVNYEVQQVAIATLSEIAQQGDEAILEVVVAELESDHWLVRESAVCALQKLLVPGDHGTVARLLALLGSRNPEVRAAALELLGDAGSGEAAMSAVADHLHEQDDAVRMMAEEAMEKMAERGRRDADAAINTHTAASLAGVADQGGESQVIGAEGAAHTSSPLPAAGPDEGEEGPDQGGEAQVTGAKD